MNMLKIITTIVIITPINGNAIVINLNQDNTLSFFVIRLTTGYKNINMSVNMYNPVTIKDKIFFAIY